MDCPDGFRIFFDASLTGHAVHLAVEDPRIIYVGHQDWPLSQSATDRDWLAYVGRCGIPVVMRDKRIRTRPGERDALLAAGVTAIVVATSRNLSIAEFADLFERCSDEIEAALVGEPGLHHLTMAGLKPMAFD